MRTIRFRGKSSRDGEWFFGNLYDKDTRGNTHIMSLERGCLVIDPDTVGEFTGLRDKNGNDIYEGDIVKRTPDINGYCPIMGVVRYSEESAQFVLTDKYGKGHPFISKERYCDGEVKYNVRYSYTLLGNIYDNIELWPTIKD